MKKILLSCALALACVTGKVHAQTSDFKAYFSLSPTEKMFTMPPWISIRDVVYLKNEEMTFELRYLTDYQQLRRLDTILQQLQTDIGFYRDSLQNGVGNIRIDYVVHTDKPQREIRFIKHPQHGEPFIVMGGETQRLKIERDTIKIVLTGIIDEPETAYRQEVSKKIPVKKSKLAYTVQATIVLNNYTGIHKVIDQWNIVQEAMDKFTTARSSREAKKPTSYPTTCRYRPYENDSAFRRFSFTKAPMHNSIDNEKENYIQANGRYTFYASIGTGIVANTLMPFADIGIARNTLLRNSSRNFLFTAISVAPYFFFNRDSDNVLHVHDNWFINLERGGTDLNNIMGLQVQSYSWGVGWLAWQNGNYFRNITTKLFANAHFKSGIIVAPEVIATNTFKQIFPGISVKLPVIRS